MGLPALHFPDGIAEDVAANAKVHSVKPIDAHELHAEARGAAQDWHLPKRPAVAIPIFICASPGPPSSTEANLLEVLLRCPTPPAQVL
eukprot:530918-Alexandrium_andersonii.AAC.1